MTTLNYRLSTPALILLAFVGTWLVPERCNAQAVPQIPNNLGTFHQVTYYSVEVQYYVTPLHPAQQSGYHYGSGHYGNLVWVVIAETESYERASALYESLLDAQEQGILDDVVHLDGGWHGTYEAVDVRMLTKRRIVYVRD